MATTSADRILSLDVIRGIAVMGIFSVNIVGMAMIENAYFYPPDYGFDSAADRVMWAINFILVDGKFRSLFSILFGASTILVIERGIAAGKEDWQVHFPRMAALLAFGLIHFYLLWWGDILTNYALVGMVAFFFWRMRPEQLLTSAIIALTLFYIPGMASGSQNLARYEATVPPGASPAQRAEALAALERDLRSTPEEIAQDRARHASPAVHFAATVAEEQTRPFRTVLVYGLETLGMMLLGMAAYKTGFLTGSWPRRRYALVGALCTGASLAYFGTGAVRVLQSNFDPLTFFAWDRFYAGPLHPVAAIGYAALIILAFPHRNAVAVRLAAVGRAAFTNYLGATIIASLLFFESGFGLYGDLSRGEVWLFVPGVWLIMLLWSKPWLDRFRYGPFEWAWRSLSRWRWEPMRKAAPIP
ncbi:conserved hypothetical protein [Altererythrobacter sp. B11]|uniref:DUF418 domain-containing protein n=1 Tax=Altererythrobacter sp. B11 TaxID=2060312 RepID=UPI000DC72750|nr:DUF418 domain-containing protein [Altererythrobacter sp. B11]BBC72730.1 conserved hypothetical protein [Altererythrobacter sp. B11]